MTQKSRAIIVAAIAIVFIGTVTACTSTNEPEKVGEEKEKEEQQDKSKETKTQKKEKEEKLISYEIIEDNDTSYAGCKRSDYRIEVDDSATKDQIKEVLEKVYKDKKDNGDKIFIYTYKNSQEYIKNNQNPPMYASRLFMKPSCDENNDYEIDFAYWEMITTENVNNF
ncbi:MAG: hypothetical protein HQ530_05640 [Parcubacteria group bacterium]|nr:hypothetical protein [Parcubacteria group bacterium]